MVTMSMLDACAAMDGTLVQGDADAVFSGAVLDSRTTRAGQLFFALDGEVTDGHRFVGKAFEAGAAGAVVSRDRSALELPASASEAVLIRVPDTYQALHALVRHVRSTTPQHLVAITGSAGKTTTKELLTAMLSARYRAAPSPGNFNNLYGFPLALLSIPNDTEWMVAEMGMSTPGELGGVSRLGRPEIGIFTNVRHAHVESFENSGTLGGRSGLEAIRDAKAELLEGLDSDGLVIVNAEDPQTVAIAERFLKNSRGGRALGFARSLSVADSALEIPLAVEVLETSAAGHRLLLASRKTEEQQEVFLPLHGMVNVENFLAAATCAFVLGVSLSEIQSSVSTMALPSGRGAVVEVFGAQVIDDSYNSNPSALEQALRAARAVYDVREVEADGGLAQGQLWAILGEMKELGSDSASLHRSAGELAGAMGFQRIVGVGEMARDLLAGAAEAGVKVEWFENAVAARVAAQRLQPNDVVLVKGSRSVGLEQVVQALRTVSSDVDVDGSEVETEAGPGTGHETRRAVGEEGAN